MSEKYINFDDYEKFQTAVGLIDSDEQLAAIGATAFVGESESGKFELDLLSKLSDFCKLNPQFHIATLTTDSDEVETEECERRAAAKGLSWEAMSDDEQEEFRWAEEICPTTIDNSIRFVNRMNFYLADGDPNPNIFLVDLG